MSTPARKILIAMDGSKYSDYAFDWYIKHFYKDKDDVILVVVDEHAAPTEAVIFPPLLPPPSAPSNSQTSDTILVSTIKEDEKGQGSPSFIVQLQKKLQAAGVRGSVLRLAGVKAGEGVITASDENKSDLIIIGTRGHGVVMRTLMGSVSLYIVHHAHVPVLVVRQ